MARNKPYDDDALARLSEYLDGGLAPGDRAALEQKLAADADLRDELAALARVDALVRAQAGPVPDLDWERFSADARRRRESRAVPPVRPLIYRLYRPLAAAAVVALVVTATLVWRGGSPTVEVAVGPPAGATVVAVVTVERAGTAAAGARGSAQVEFSQALPPDVVATVGPVPKGRTLIVSVDRGALGSLATSGDDDAALF